VNAYIAATILDRVVTTMQRANLKFIMDQSDCTIIENTGPVTRNKNRFKPDFRNPLSRIWESSRYNPSGLYDESNTLMLDDSIEKLVGFEMNTLLIPCFDVANEDARDDCELLEVINYLQSLCNSELSVPKFLQRNKFIPTNMSTSVKTRASEDNIKKLLSVDDILSLLKSETKRIRKKQTQIK